MEKELNMNQEPQVKEESKECNGAPAKLKKSGEEQVVYIDLGNFNYKMLYGKNGEKRAIDFSNVERVGEGAQDSWTINGEKYIMGPSAKIKYDTDKICQEKKALLARALYPIVADKSKVRIVTLLPLSLYVNAEDGNKEAYIELLKGKYTISNHRGHEKTFTVSEVEVYCESFSSLMLEPNHRKTPLYLVDLGGVDWSGAFVYQLPDRKKKFNRPTGMNLFYSELGERLKSVDRREYNPVNARLMFDKYSNTTDEEIEQTEKDESKRLKKKEFRRVINAFAESYIQKHIYEELHRIEYNEDIHELVFVGGGAESLKKYLKADSNATIVEDSVYTNIEGARMISMQRGRRRNSTQSQKRGAN